MHDGAVVVPRVLDGAGRVLDALHRDAAHAVRFGETGEVGTGERRAAVALALEQLLPLPHHAEVAVVDDGDLDVA